MKQLFAIDVSSWISTLFVATQGSRRITYPVIPFLVLEEHNGANFKSAHHSIYKLHLFWQAPVIYFPIITVQIDLSVSASF